MHRKYKTTISPLSGSPKFQLQLDTALLRIALGLVEPPLEFAAVPFVALLLLGVFQDLPAWLPLTGVAAATTPLEHAVAGSGEVGRANEPIVARADNDRVVAIQRLYPNCGRVGCNARRRRAERHPGL